MTAPPEWTSSEGAKGSDALEPLTPPPGVSLEPFRGSPSEHRELFRLVGERWLWFSRLLRTDDDIRALLTDPRVESLVLTRGGVEIGMLELDFTTEGECELTFLGLVESEIGRGLGRWLMSEAIRRAWSRPIRRLWVHTCTLDHPAALAFYLRSGFRVYGRAIEIAPDPRLAGHLPRSAAPHVPIVE
jgi:GNAT superfamily N-acetyltransferase